MNKNVQVCVDTILWKLISICISLCEYAIHVTVLNFCASFPTASPRCSSHAALFVHVKFNIQSMSVLLQSYIIITIIKLRAFHHPKKQKRNPTATSNYSQIFLRLPRGGQKMWG